MVYSLPMPFLYQKNTIFVQKGPVTEKFQLDSLKIRQFIRPFKHQHIDYENSL